MPKFSSVFHVPDHRNVIVRSVRRSQELAEHAPSSYYFDKVLDDFADIIQVHAAAQFSGLFADDGGDFLDVESILERIARFDLGSDNTFLQRYSHLTAYQRPNEKRRPLADLVRAVEQSSYHLWYDDLKDLPRKLASRFETYTFVYFDLEDSEIAQKTVYLYTEFDAALVKLIVDEPYGPWEPVGLFAGDVVCKVTLEELRKSASFHKFERRVGAAAALTASSGSAGDVERAVPDIMAEVLLHEAVRDMHLAEPVEGASNQDADDQSWELFVQRIIESRPLTVVETQYWEIAENIGACLAQALSMRFTTAARVFGSHDLSELSQDSRLVLFDDRIFGKGKDVSQDWSRQAIKNLMSSRHFGLCVVGNRHAIPKSFQDHVEVELELPMMTPRVRDQILERVFGRDALGDNEDDSWTRYILPLDVQKIATAGLSGRRALKDLKERVERRLANKNATKSPSLADIHGLGEAKAQAEELIADIKLAASGEIAWNEVDKGMLLVGPPGTGKTMLARAISKDTGLRFVHGSTSEWFSTRYISTHIAAIREFFMQARRHAPTIAFIDEFDSIGNRQHDHGVNNIYVNDIVNTMLEELQGFEEREGIVVIAATNNPDAIDPALKRAGRLDQIIRVPLPTVQGLAKIYDFYIERLKQKGLIGEVIDTSVLARLTVGQTGADVEFYARGARRRARKAGRLILHDDFVAEIMSRPISDSGLRRLDEDELKRTAVHEAGHAVIQLTGPSKGEDITYVSIIPRPDGTLGFVARYSEQTALSRDEIFEFVRIVLAGRAAEEVIYGRQAVTTGAGGPARSDLAQATDMLMRAFYQYGFSEETGLLWHDIDKVRQGVLPPPPALHDEVRRNLDALYGHTLKRLKDSRSLLDKIAKALMDKQEMSGLEVRQLARSKKMGRPWRR